MSWVGKYLNVTDSGLPVRKYVFIFFKVPYLSPLSVENNAFQIQQSIIIATSASNDRI